MNTLNDFELVPFNAETADETALYCNTHKEWCQPAYEACCDELIEEFEVLRPKQTFFS